MSRVKWNCLWIFCDGIFHLAGVLSTRSYVMMMRTRLNLQRGPGNSVELGIMKYYTHILRHKRMKAYQAFALSYLLGGLGIHIFELDFSTPSLILYSITPSMPSDNAYLYVNVIRTVRVFRITGTCPNSASLICSQLVSFI